MKSTSYEARLRNNPESEQATGPRIRKLKRFSATATRISTV